MKAAWSSNPWVWVVSFRRLDVANAPTLPVGAKERPILFSGPMVRAILEGRKTQTRRVMNPQPRALDGRCVQFTRGRSFANSEADGTFPRWMLQDRELSLCPYGVPGDRLWVRETWLQWECPRHDEGQPPGTRCDCDDPKSLRFLADHPVGTDREIHAVRWRPSIHMPRYACRLVLEVTDVRVERLHDISEEDARAEGTDWKSDLRLPESSHFRRLWESIHG